jgi:hypothetical protein
VFRDIEMNKTAAILPKDDEDEQNPEGGGRQLEEVYGHQVLHMIIEKAPPRLGGWLQMANNILGHGGLGNGYAKLHQLAMHAGGAPNRIGSAHFPDQLLHFRSDAWPILPAPPALPCPVAFEPGAMPPDHRLGFHDDDNPISVSPDSAQGHPKTAVHIREPRSFHRTLEDGELLAQGEILDTSKKSSVKQRISPRPEWIQ